MPDRPLRTPQVYNRTAHTPREHKLETGKRGRRAVAPAPSGDSLNWTHSACHGLPQPESPRPAVCARTAARRPRTRTQGSPSMASNVRCVDVGFEESGEARSPLPVRRCIKINVWILSIGFCRSVHVPTTERQRSTDGAPHMLSLWALTH